ncbi:hypothetical protein D920_02319 [Enterococcus faecalis 13-SD-W-01]|nr:hypothetical protein D920_02319 [Enterococcus faecalis 13-SD-W-01]
MFISILKVKKHSIFIIKKQQKKNPQNIFHVLWILLIEITHYGSLVSVQ